MPIPTDIVEVDSPLLTRADRRDAFDDYAAGVIDTFDSHGIEID